jgi:two-component system nitrogen regulation sensor histidine kinase NtrY
MGFRLYNWKVVFYLALIILSAGTGSILLFGPTPDLALFPVLVLVLSVLLLLREIRKTEKNIGQFFEAVESNDYSLTFKETNRNQAIRNLYHSMNRINEQIREMRRRNEVREKYYRLILQQSATGLVVLTPDGEVELVNEAAARFSGISPESTDPRLLKIRNPVFFSQIQNTRPGEHHTFRNMSGGSDQTFLFRAIEIVAAGKPLKLVSIENIRRELDHKELESYQNLIRVLTHEIMNSVSPLTSITGTLRRIISPEGTPIDPGSVDRKVVRALLKGLATMDDQTRGMVNFVQNYRKLTKLPEPVIESFDTDEWLEKLKILVSDRLKSDHILMKVERDPGIPALYADKNLLGQVVLNLINNALDALKEIPGNRELGISVFRREHQYIRVANNGPAIPPDEMEKIFVPFYTTKENGSGIGLYLSRQIIHRHNGAISLTSNPGETAFVIELEGREVQKN